MKAKQRKLIPAIAMLVVAAVTLTSASYAWFTMSREVTATGIQLTATAPTNLLITSETNWNSHTSGNSGLKDFASSTQVTLSTASGKTVGKLMPASSKDGVNLFYPNTILEENSGAPTADTVFKAVEKPAGAATVSAEGASVDGYYIDIPLWLKNDGNTAVNVTINKDKTQIKAVNTDQIYKAVRFAILDESGAKFATSDMDGWMMKSSDAAMLSGLNGPITTAGKGEAIFKGSADTATDFASGGKTLFTIDANEANATKIIVRVWIEGQDAACIYDNRNHSFAIDLVLSDLTYLQEQTTATA